MRYLLDTNILIAYVRRKPLWERIRARFNLFLHEPTPAISAIVEGEVRSFAIQNKWGDKKRSDLEYCIGCFLRVNFNKLAIIRAYAAIDAWCVEQGLVLSKNDIWIAATAQATNATLLSTDKDYVPLTEKFIKLTWIEPD